MIRHTLIFLLALSAVACTNPLASGPGRVVVKLDQAAIQLVPHSTLFPESSNKSGAPREALRLSISSQTDLLKYFQEWQRHLQVRCSVDGNVNGRAYKGFAIDLIPENEELPHPTTLNRYHYTIYAFIDLEADDVEYKGGKPATTLDLKTERFDSLRCHLIGVEKAPVLFPRSNDVSVSAKTFHELLAQAQIR